MDEGAVVQGIDTQVVFREKHIPRERRPELLLN